MFGKHLFFFVFPKLGISYKAKKASWTVCITPHSAMDNTIHSIWKSKSSFPTSCKQCCPQLHKTGSYTHYAQCRRRRNPTHLFIPTLKIKNFFKEKEPQHFCQGSGKSFLMGSTGCLLLRKLQRTCFING